MLFNDFPLRARRALLLYKVYGDSALLVLNGTLLNSNGALMVLSRRHVLCTVYYVTCSVHVQCMV